MTVRKSKSVAGFSSTAARSSEAVQPLRYETLVDAVIRKVMEEAARGAILPGDRIVEAEMAQQLGISRVPFREAIRILENQGIVTSTPFKGIRLTPVSAERINNLLEARVALETTAVARAVANGKNGPVQLAELQRMIDEMELMMVRGDSYGFATADTAFHRLMVGYSDNLVLCQLWEMLARQLTIIFGLSTLAKSMSEVVDEHRRLMRVFKSGNVGKISSELEEHISAQVRAVDLATVIEQRIAERDGRLALAKRPSRRPKGSTAKRVAKDDHLDA